MSYMNLQALSNGFQTVKALFLLNIMLVLFPANQVLAQDDTNLYNEIAPAFKKLLALDLYYGESNYLNGKKIALDTAFYENDTVKLYLNKAFAEMPVRESHIVFIEDSLRQLLPVNYRDVPVAIYTNGMMLQELVPNSFRKELKKDLSRMTPANRQRKNVVSKSLPYSISNGLVNSNIALWHSHGWYYEPTLDRWEWQRARLFTTLEDISPAAFVVPYIAPMLENAGANVFLPRERDWQVNEVIVDNNGSTGRGKFKKPKGKKQENEGFALGRQPYDNENPFTLGTSIQFRSSKKGNAVSYIPEIPETGEYGVYVSYGAGEGKVTYRVYHSGGVSEFEIDQSMGYGTWIYLDKFHFKKGYDKKGTRVELIVPEGAVHRFSADAVRFGGGMGVIERNGLTGGKARFFEGARYYLQYAGAPDTLVWNLSEGKDDYGDDYKSRGEWVDWLMGAPFGPTKNRQHPGLKIPIDLAFAFHTDAGILPGEGIVGTLGIYSTDREETRKFPDGQSKYASRDLTDLVQTQIVNDINAIYKCNWTRRGMWNAQYSEAYRPQVPTMLLELLSHQNLNDVKYVLNPHFRFDVSRAIYKAMLRFVATQNGSEFVVQPLPVNNLSAEFTAENTVKLSWKPVVDELEPTAVAEKYMVYRRTGENGFDNGTLVAQNEITLSNLEKGKVYGFKVTAVNAGGESFPSEVLSVGIAENNKGNVLIVNGFDRIDGPAIFETDSLSGVLRQLDHGVAYGYDMATTGDQYDFERNSPWLDDDSPGHGASYADLENTIFRGNTFDFSYQHGASLLANGHSFVTTSDEALVNKKVVPDGYVMVDLLYGEEKTSFLPGKDSTVRYDIYTEGLVKVMEDYAKQGGHIFISGAYIGTEIPKEKEKRKQLGELFGFKWRTNYAVRNGRFYSVSEPVNYSGEYNTDYCMEQYAVEAPDGIEPFNEMGTTIIRYGENNVSAGVFYNNGHKVVSLGFPFETVKGENQRNELMEEILELFNK